MALTESEGSSMAMKRSAAGVSIAISLALLTPTTTFADTRPNAPEVQSYKSEVDSYKQAMEVFRQELQRYEESRRSINALYKAAIERALAESKFANDSRASQLQKRQSFATKRSAVVVATSIRDAAMAALGQAPIPPMEPIKPEPGAKARKGPKPKR